MAVETRSAAIGQLDARTKEPVVRIQRLRSVRTALQLWFPVAFLTAMLLACFVWPEVYPLRSPTEGNLSELSIAPLSPHYLLGTDPLGRDVLSRLLYGGRVSIEVGFSTALLGFLIGGFLGVFAGFRGGAVDTGVMRILDIFIAFPALILAIAVASYLGPSELHVIWAITFFTIPAFARLARGGTLKLREETYVKASSLSGSREWRVISRHIFPNVAPQLLTFSMVSIGAAIMVEAALSFLGLGVPPPAASWGSMISTGQAYLYTNPDLILIPAAFLFATVYALNVLSDSIRARWGTA